MRGGLDYDSTFGKRMRGVGQFADLIEKRFNLACKKFGLNGKPSMPLDITVFKKISGKQLSLF